MLDRTGDWCFEGDCTYLTTDFLYSELDTEELEAMYSEDCIGKYD